jgi:hypothetical protein
MGHNKPDNGDLDAADTSFVSSYSIQLYKSTTADRTAPCDVGAYT